MDDVYLRKVQTSVTCFLRVGDEYLFLLRRSDSRIDPGKLNGIGGRVEPGENYVAAAVRETREETGYIVTEEQMSLAGVVRLEGGYDEDWIMCFFTIQVPTKDIPLGVDTPDGKLMWMHKDDVLRSNFTLVDDLHYCFADVASGNGMFFANATVGKDEKIITWNASHIRKQI